MAVAAALTLCAGCAGSDNPGLLDSSTRVDTGTGPTDSGMADDTGMMTTCPPGRHVCGGGCIDDLPNEPGNGCRLGCGEACPMPPTGAVSCNEAGRCDVACVPPSVPTEDGCSCDPETCEALGFQCGDQDDGCGGTLECGACADGTMCGDDGTCGCLPDTAEVNDTRLDAHSLGSFDDTDDREASFTTFALSSATDEDWYEVAVIDGTGGGLTPELRVNLSAIPAGANFDLAVYFVCNESDEDVTCASGMPDDAIGQGCASASTGSTSEQVELAVDCTGILQTDDSGTAWIRVTSSTWANSCAPYQLDVTVF